MTVEGAPVWNLATLMPDGAVGASAAGGRAVLADPALKRFAHWLRGVRRSRPHRLSEPEERLLAEKMVTLTEALTGLERPRNLDEARDVAPAIPA